MVVYNELSPPRYYGGSGLWVFRAPQWPIVQSSIHFVIKADLVSAAGYDSCYLNLPQLFSPTLLPISADKSWFLSFLSAYKAGKETAQLASRGVVPEPFKPPSALEAGLTQAGWVTASVTDRPVIASTIGAGANASEGEVDYLCHVDSTPVNSV